MSITTESAPTMIYCGRKALVDDGAALVDVSGITEDGVLTPDGAQHPMTTATLLPLGGECITAELPQGTVSGRWLGLVEPRESGASVTAWVLDPVAGALTHTFAPGAVDARTAVTPGCPHADAALADALVAGLTERARTGESHHAWMETLVADAHEWATEHDLCSTFDEFMEDHGLPGREREYSFDVSVSATATVSITATSRDAAMEAIGVSDVMDGIDSYSLDYQVE